MHVTNKLTLTKCINCQVCINSYHEDTGLLSIHKALGDGIWCKDLISEIILGENKFETKDNFKNLQILNLLLLLLLSHLADAFIQSDLQMRTTEAIN